MAEDEDVIYVDVVPRLDEKETEKSGKALDENLKKSAKATGKEIGQQVNAGIQQEVNANAEKQGTNLRNKLKAGTKGAGRDIGAVLQSEIAAELEKNSQGIVDSAKKIGSLFGSNLGKFLEKENIIGEPFKKLKEAVTDKDLSKGLSVLSEGLKEIEEAKGAADAVDKMSAAFKNDVPYLSDFKNHLKDTKGLFEGFDKDAGGLEGKLGKIGGKIGQLNGVIGALESIYQLINDPEISKMMSGAPIIGDNSTLDKLLFQGPARVGEEMHNWLKDHGLDLSLPVDPKLQKPGSMFGPEIKTDYLGRKVAKGSDGYDHLVDDKNNFIDPGKGWFFAKNRPDSLSALESKPVEPDKSPDSDKGSAKSSESSSGLGGRSSGPVHVIVDGFANGASAAGLSAATSAATSGMPSVSGAGVFQLPYDRSIQAQALSINCGPSAANIVLNGQGIFKGQQGLTADMGTVAKGQTDFGTELATLQKYAPQAGYTGVTGQNNPKKLMADLSKSVESGYGGVLNYDLVNGVRVQGVNGTNAPNYSEGTQHYVAVMGADEKNGNIRVADPAPQGRGSDYWISAANAAAATAGRGYIYGGTGGAGAAGGGRRGGMSQGYSGGMPGAGASIFGGGYVPGIVSPPTMPNLGGPTATGPKQQQPFGSGQGAGISGGGVIGGIEQGAVAAATAAGMMGAGGPAAGMAAQAGMQIMNQAIATGTQAASIAASIPLETFGLRGGQMGAGSVQLGGWGGKILQGLIGQQANSANIAGGTQPPKKPEDNDPLNGSTNPQTPSGPSGAKDDPIHVKSADGPAQPPQGSATSAMNATGQMSAMPA